MPTTVTKSIGSGGGRDYSTLALWEADCPANLVTVDQIWKGECYNDAEFSGSGTSELVYITGMTTDATRYVWLTAATGQSFADHANKLTNALRYNQSNGVALTYSGSYSAVIRANVNVKITRLQVKRGGTTGGSNSGGIALNDNVGTQLLDQCLFEATAPMPTGANGGAVRLEYGGKATNCLIVLRGSAGNALFLYEGADAFNCTVVRPSNLSTAGTGVHKQYGTPTLKNCAVFGPFSSTFNSTTGWSASTGYNASDAASAPGSNNQTSLTFADQVEQPSDASGAHDFRLKSTLSGGCKDNANTDTTNVPDANDIVGTARSGSWDIGCWELTAGGGGATAIPVFMHHYRQQRRAA